MKFLRLNVYTQPSVGITRRASNKYSHEKYVNNALGGKINFEKDFNKCHIETSNFQKLLLSLGSGFMSITDPKRGDMVAVMGESTGARAFDYIRKRMLQSDEGRQILEEKPRISSASVNLEELKQMPEGTLGKAYSNFLERYKYSPDERLAVRFVDDFELAYVAQRYREAHDLFHTVLDMPTNMLGEVTVKWVEAIQTRLPMCVTGALFGSLRLAPKFTRTYTTTPHFDAILDPEVQKGIEENIFSPKVHPGKLKKSESKIIIPEKFKNSVTSVLNNSNIKFSKKEVSRFSSFIYSMDLMGQIRNQNISDDPTVATSNEIESNMFVDSYSEDGGSAVKKTGQMLKRIHFTKELALLYLQSRAYTEYSAVAGVLKEISRRDTNFKPNTLFDFGSGVGTVVWAASSVWGTAITECLTVDTSEDMNNLAWELANTNPPIVKNLVQKRVIPASDVGFDLVVSAFAFSHLQSFEERMCVLNLLWNKTNSYLVILENGTKSGFHLIKEARDMLLQQSKALHFKCHVFAPCPHDLPCPKTRTLRCFFPISYSEGKNSPHIVVPVSFVIFKREKRSSLDKQWPVAVDEVLLRKNHVVCNLCTKKGKIECITTAKKKHGPVIYRFMRSLKHGERFPGDIEITPKKKRFTENSEDVKEKAD